MTFDRRYLCTDRQDYMVNWNDRSDKKTIQLTAVATADLDSGYIFGLLPNFDGAITPDELEAQWLAADDQSKPIPLRKTARLWTEADYKVSAGGSAADLNAPENLSTGQQLPKTGCQVHADYLMHGHYQLLRHHFQGAEKLRFFLDQDSGLLGACMGAFADRVKTRTADIILVDIEKSLTVNARNSAFANAAAWFKIERTRFPALSDKQATSAIMAEIIAATRSTTATGRLSDVWIQSPFPDQAEPGKRLRFITDLGDYDAGHAANLLLKATLWPVDTAFNQVRRRLSLCERPVTSRRRANRLWHIYAPYEPAMLIKALTVFRVWHNYIWIGAKTKTTAAEKLKLAHGQIRIQDILSFAKNA